MMADQALRIAKALQELDKEHSEYGPLISRVRLVKDNRPKTTMWMNPHCEMGYSEACTSKLTSKELKALVHHELQHILNGHFLRIKGVVAVFGKEYPFRLHNIAMDLEINSTIQDLPKWLHFPKNYKFPDNLTYEEYFQKLIKDSKIYYGAQDLIDPNDATVSWINLCDDVQNDTSDDFEVSMEDELFNDDLLQEVEQASQSRSSAGTSLGKSAIKLTQQKPLNILSYIRTHCSNIKYAHTFGFDLINYNSIKTTTIPNILNFGTHTEVVSTSMAFIIDVSGSRSDSQINSSISKILALLKTVDDMEFVLDIFFTDANVTQVNRITKPSDIPKTYKGRGGTVLSSAFKHFEINYDLVIIMTDGFIDWTEVNHIDPKYRRKTVIGIDKASYLNTFKKLQITYLCFIAKAFLSMSEIEELDKQKGLRWTYRKNYKNITKS